MDKYIEKCKKHSKVNNKPIYPHDLVEANKHRLYVDRLYKDIKRIGYTKYRITKNEMLELNNLYKQYRIDLDIHPQYEPPRIRIHV